jgi:hypothetical protein
MLMHPGCDLVYLNSVSAEHPGWVGENTCTSQNIENKGRRRCLLSHKTTVAPAYFHPEFFATQKGLLIVTERAVFDEAAETFLTKRKLSVCLEDTHTWGFFPLLLIPRRRVH